MAKKVLDLLIENGVEQSEVIDVLSNISKDIETILWHKTAISLPLFYSLKDIVWYNLEHLPSTDHFKGNSNLIWMGSKYPSFIFLESVYIQNNELQSILRELEEIRSLWSNDWYYVTISCKTSEWHGGSDNPSDVIIYEKGIERPSKYGYNQNTLSSTILNDKGEKITSQSETVLCAIESKLGSYGHEPLLRNVLEKLIADLKRAVDSQKGLLLDINNYDYN